ncbi:MAG: TonB-dependent receptor, partial [Colwellia sp.]
YSLGIVYQATDEIKVTVDLYAIDIEDRIVISNKLGEGLSSALDAALKASGIGVSQFFLNGADTETAGLDMIVTWNTDAFDGVFDMTLAANFTETDVVDIFTPKNSRLEDISPDKIFSEQDISIIEEWQPENRISLSTLYKKKNWSVNLTFNRYGDYTIMDGGRQNYGA